jgi:hypothetical protein
MGQNSGLQAKLRIAGVRRPGMTTAEIIASAIAGLSLVVSILTAYLTFDPDSKEGRYLNGVLF